MTMTAAQLVTHLNALNVGEMDRVREKLAEARDACAAIDQADLAEKLGEASAALDRADLKTYRKRVETVIAKLGHLK